MRAKYLLRFDDITPTTQWAVWSEIEKILEDTGVKPLLAVVPDNQDPTLEVAPPDANFWDRVRSWQRRGWTIGLHGFQHRYVTQDPGIIGINKYSEFAGLPAEEQERKLQKGIEIFRREQVRPDVWIAPAHSFDHTTLAILKRLGISIISDGFFLYPFVDSDGMMWLPQQLWGFRQKALGVWTICIHCNKWTKEQILEFRRDINFYGQSVVTFDEVVARYKNRRRSWIDTFACQWMRGSRRMKQTNWYRSLRGKRG